MAGFDALPAMGIDPVGTGLRNSVAMDQAQQSYRDSRAEKSLLPAMTAAQQQQYQTQAAQGPLDRQAAQEKSELLRTDYGNQQMAQVANEALAADPGDAPAVWDKGMQALSSKGITNASQYIGHYRGDLAERVGDIFSGKAKPTDAAAGMDMNAVYQQIAKLSPAQRQETLQRQNAVIEGFNAVKDQASWDDELVKLQKLGIPTDKIFPPGADWRLSYGIAHKLVQQLTPVRDQMQQYVMSEAMGAPAPAPKVPTNMLPSYGIAGYDANGVPQFYNKRNPTQTVAGPNSIVRKPSAGAETFNAKYTAYLTQHPGDTDGALQFANGKTQQTDAQLQEMAMNQANKELGDATLAGATIADPDAWVRDKAKKNYELMKQKPQAAAPSAGGGQSKSRLSAADIAVSRDNAKKAIAAGAPKAAVIKKLQAAGVPTTGL